MHAVTAPEQQIYGWACSLLKLPANKVVFIQLANHMFILQHLNSKYEAGLAHLLHLNANMVVFT